MKISQAHKAAAQRLLDSQDYQLVKELLQEYLDSIIDIRTLSATEKTMDKNAVWVGRLAGYTALSNFLNAINLLGKKTSSIKEESFE